MKKALALTLVIAACSTPTRTPSPVPARVAMDSTQIARTCAQPGLVQVGLAECELKDQSPQIPVSPLSFP